MFGNCFGGLGNLFGGGGMVWIWGILLVVLAWLCGCGGRDC